MLWVLVAIASAELVVVHALLMFWFPRLAVALSLLSLGSVAWLVSAIRSFPKLPVTLNATILKMRAGRLKGVDVPVERISGLIAHWDAQTLKQSGTLNCALIAYPNVVLTVEPPVMVRRMGRDQSVNAVAHRLDDPAAFARAIQAIGRQA